MAATGRKKNVTKPGLIRRSLPALAAITLMLMIGLTINFRGYTERTKGEAENRLLNERIQEMTEENLALQEEVHELRTDPAKIEDEARRYGLRRPQK
jgi:cell division protein FtsB